jgi:hypothetical protein
MEKTDIINAITRHVADRSLETVLPGVTNTVGSDYKQGFIDLERNLKQTKNYFDNRYITDQAFLIEREKTNRSFETRLKELPEAELQKIVNALLIALKEVVQTDNENHTILFVGISPNNLEPLQTTAEYRKIRGALELRSNVIGLQMKEPVLAATFRDFIKYWEASEPTIIHLTGHGEKNGIAFADANNQWVMVKNKTLEELFKLYKEKIKCVFLSSCYSGAQAKLISTFGIVVIGMNKPIGDETAAQFAESFYTFLGKDGDYQKAFSLASIEMQPSNWTERKIPELWINGEKANGVKK